MPLTQLQIDQLINCDKKIVTHTTGWRLPAWKPDRGHHRIALELQSTDEEFLFNAFGRYNSQFEENFSFGLLYIPKHEKGSYEIVRCNGPHGEHLQYPHHVHYHIHKATE